VQSVAGMICRADAVVRMLHLNAPPAANGRSAAAPATEEGYYKVLVLDAFTKDVLAPLLRVNDLRRHGITLHLLLEVTPCLPMLCIHWLCTEATSARVRPSPH
jgi:hypothetical protein